MNIIKKITPPRLRPGDTLGIAAPAGSSDPENLRRGRAVLESMGFRILLPRGLFEKKGYLAGSDAHRASVLMKLFADKSVRGIICARGGFGSMRLLSLLDFAMIRENPKIFVGFSDISALLSALYTKCGLGTFHGPVLTTLGDADRKTKEGMLSALSSDSGIEIKAEKGIAIRPGSASGPVAGGNLSTLCHLVGTAFAPEFRKHILFLEDTHEPAYKIDRMLTQMKFAGCFEEIAGLVLGSFENCGSPDDIFRIVNNIFRENAVPVLAGLDAGHGSPNMTIPMGAEAMLDADKHLLSYHKPPTAGLTDDESEMGK